MILTNSTQFLHIRLQLFRNYLNNEVTKRDILLKTDRNLDDIALLLGRFGCNTD